MTNIESRWTWYQGAQFALYYWSSKNRRRPREALRQTHVTGISASAVFHKAVLISSNKRHLL